MNPLKKQIFLQQLIMSLSCENFFSPRFLKNYDCVKDDLVVNKKINDVISDYLDNTDGNDNNVI